VVDHRGQVLAKANDDDNSKDQETSQGIEITYNNSKIGSYDITFSKRAMQSALRDQSINNIVVVACLLLASLIAVYLLMQKLVLNPVAEVTRSLASIADGGGDLSRRLPTDSRDEVAALAHNFNRVLEHISGIIRNVVNVNEKVRQNVSTMSHATEIQPHNSCVKLNLSPLQWKSYPHPPMKLRATRAILPSAPMPPAFWPNRVTKLLIALWKMLIA
jgi:methyl-accepting chemotaxis protein